MPDSLAKEIHDAAQDGRLGSVDIETVVRWIRMALDLEEMHEKINFVKTLILRKSAEISRERSNFTATELFSHFGGLLNENAQSVIIAALHDLSAEGKIVALDPGTPTIYSFINEGPDGSEHNRLAGDASPVA